MSQIKSKKEKLAKYTQSKLWQGIHHDLQPAIWKFREEYFMIVLFMI